jgi:hypothetical protein
MIFLQLVVFAPPVRNLDQNKAKVIPQIWLIKFSAKRKTIANHPDYCRNDNE